MKKGFVLALALLTVFAMLGCDTEEKVEPPGPTDEYFVPPASWVGFSDEEMLAGKFYIGYGGENPVTTSIEKKGSGFEVKIKTLTNTTARQSVLSLNFETTIFQKGHYVSLTLPTAGGNARPTNIIVYPMIEGTTNASGGSGVAWNASSDAITVGEQAPATLDGKYLVGDLKMDWRNEAADVNLTGLSLWFQWDEDATLGNDNKDYVFTINTIKVNKSGEVEPPLPPMAKSPWPFELGEFNWDNGASQMGWRSNGNDGHETDLPIEVLVGASKLVLELSQTPRGGFQFVWSNQSEGWVQVDAVLSNNGTPDPNKGATIVPNGDGVIFSIELSKVIGTRYEEFKASTSAKFLIAYYTGGGIVGLGLEKAYLVGNYDLGLEFTAVNNATQSGWCTDGTDDKDTPLLAKTLVAAKYVVLELDHAPTGGLQFIWQGNGDGWTWNEQGGVLTNTGGATDMATVTEGDDGIFTLKIDLSKAVKNYEGFLASTQVKFFIAYYSPNVAALGITKAYLEL
jgi:hypothetical protein